MSIERLIIKHTKRLKRRKRALSSKEIDTILDEFKPYRLEYFFDLLESLSSEEYQLIFEPNLNEGHRMKMLKDKAYETLESSSASSGYVWSEHNKNSVIEKYGTPLN